MDLGAEAMGLRLLRALPEDGGELGERGVVVALSEQRLGQDQSGRRVVGIAVEATPAERDGVTGTARLPVEIGELGEGERLRIPLEPLFVPTDGAGDRGIVHRHCRTVIRGARFACQRATLRVSPASRGRL